MRITQIEIYNYIPLLHCGTKRIKVDINANALIVIGTNGCGKSSLFRELTPYPANRADYEKNGYKKLIIEHEKSTYELCSDFTKPTKAHSFIKDGEELNESGTNATQIDLCDTHFGLSEVINNLINLNYHICDMGRAERKNLFMSAYPYSMSFILDYHKKVCYQLRDFSSNIKAFNERRLLLEEKIINDTERKRLDDMHKKYQDLNNDIDQQIYALRQNIALFESLPDYALPQDSLVKHALDNMSVDEYLESLNRRVTVALHKLTRFKRKNKWYKFNSDLTVATSNMVQEARKYGDLKSELDKQVFQLHQETKELKEQLDQYEQTKGIDLEAEIKTLKDRLANMTALLDKHSKAIQGKVFPKIANHEELLRINDGIINRIRYLLSEIFQSTVIWSPVKVDQTKQCLWGWRLEIDNNEKQLEYLVNQLKELKRQSLVVENIDPNCTSMVCKLKERVEAKLQETKRQIDQVVAQGKELRARTEVKKAEYKKLEDELKNPLDINDYVKDLINCIQQAGLADFICDGKWNIDVLIDTLNNNGSKIWDKLSAYIDLNTSYLECRTLEQDIKITKQELDTLVNIHLPAKNLIVKTISEKKLKHEKLLATLNELDKLEGEYEDRECRLYDASRETSNLKTCGEELTTFCKWYSIKLRIDQSKELLAFFNNAKSKIMSAVIDVESVLNEQDGLLLRLKEEIIPAINHYEKEYQVWSEIEKGLNPNSGIPQKYMVGYINALIDIVNRIIKHVWVYDMEIVPLRDDADLNYNLSFTVNNGEPIKDINLASKGQKEIMDLAWVLAIFHQMKLGKNYPLKLDEPDGGLNNEHRVRLLNFLQQMMQNEDLKQLFMINQFPSVYDSFISSQTLCIKEEGILLPAEYNQDIEIDRV